jgi:hypothetical protein
VCTCGHKYEEHDIEGPCVSPSCDCLNYTPLGSVDQTGEVEIVIDEDSDDKPPEAA